jgi:hypothetical protein
MLRHERDWREMRQRRIESSELISETRRIRIEICCRCPTHVQAAHALHLGMVKDLKRLPPEDPEKCPTPRHRRFSHASRRIFVRSFRRNRLTKVARRSARLFARFSARRCARLSECHDHRIADASSLMRQQYSVTEDLKWARFPASREPESATP